MAEQTIYLSKEELKKLLENGVFVGELLEKLEKAKSKDYVFSGKGIDYYVE